MISVPVSAWSRHWGITMAPSPFAFQTLHGKLTGHLQGGILDWVQLCPCRAPWPAQGGGNSRNPGHSLASGRCCPLSPNSSCPQKPDSGCLAGDLCGHDGGQGPSRPLSPRPAWFSGADFLPSLQPWTALLLSLALGFPSPAPPQVLASLSPFQEHLTLSLGRPPGLLPQDPILFLRGLYHTCN